MQSTAAVDESSRWTEALAAIGLGEDIPAPAPDLALFFVTPGYPEMDHLVAETYRRSAASVLVGCTGGGVIGTGREIEGRKAVSILNLSLPGTAFQPRHVEMDDLGALQSSEACQQWIGLSPDELNAFVIFADPFTFDT